MSAPYPTSSSLKPTHGANDLAQYLLPIRCIISGSIDPVDDFVPILSFNTYYRFYEAKASVADVQTFADDPLCLVFSCPIHLLVYWFRFLTLRDLRKLTWLHRISNRRNEKEHIAIELMKHTCATECAGGVYIFKPLANARIKVTLKFGYIRGIDTVTGLNEVAENASNWPTGLNSEPDDDDDDDPLDFDPFEILGDEVKHSIIRNWEKEVSTEKLRMVVCAACGKRNFQSFTQWIDGRTIDFTLLRNEQLPPEVLPRSYNLDAYQQAILNAKGLEDTQNIGRIRLCDSCCKALRNKTMPKFALCNWLYYGHEALPEEVKEAFSSASMFEKMLVGRARSNSICCRFDVKRDGEAEVGTGSVLSKARKGIRGNVIVAPLDVIQLHSLLPPAPSSIRDTMCAVFVGASLPNRQNIQKFSPVLVRKSRVKMIIDFLMSKNPHYEQGDDLQFSASNLAALHQGQDLAVPLNARIERIDANDAMSSLTSGYAPRYETSEAESDELLMENVGYTNGDNSPIKYAEMKAQALERCLSGKPFLASGTGSGLVPDFHNPQLLSWLFPHLDPWGIGGFHHPLRKIKISMEDQVSHLLLLDGCDFERDSEFAFVFFNIIRKLSISNSMRYTVPQETHRKIIKELLAIDPQTLVDLNEKCKVEPFFKPVNDEEKKAFKVVSSLGIIARCVPGSDGYKLTQRNQIRGLIVARDTPNLLVTLNPSDVDNPIVRLFAGEDINLEDLSRGEDMTEWNRKLFAAHHPAACAMFFHVMITKFIQVLLRFGRDEPGVYGRCEAYYGTVEAQGKGTLHCHMLIWLKGHLHPQGLRDAMLSSPEYRDRVLRWLESIIKCELPGDKEEIKTPPENLERKRAKEFGNPHPGTIPHPSPDLFEPNDLKEELERYLTQLLHEYNWHCHQPTCWKYLKRGQEKSDANCRLGMNGMTRQTSYIDPDTHSVLLRRWHPKIASFTDLVTLLLKCNMDIKFVGSGDAAKAFLYYATDYITKSTLSLHAGMAALILGVKKVTERLGSEAEGVEQSRVVGAVTAVVNSMMGKQEILHPQVMSYLVGGGDHYTSEKFQNLYWGVVVRYAEHILEKGTDKDPLPVCGPEMTVELTLGVKDVTASSQILDYIYRSKAPWFDGLCFYQFVAKTRKAKPPADIPVEAYPGAFISEDHPQRDSHYLAIRKERYIPVILGPSIPNPNISEGNREKWCRDVLLLFKPWRSPLELKTTTETWVQAYEDFEPTIPKHLRRVIRNLNILNECREARDHHRSQRQLEGEMIESSGGGYDFDEEMMNKLIEVPEGLQITNSEHLARILDAVGDETAMSEWVDSLDSMFNGDASLLDLCFPQTTVGEVVVAENMPHKTTNADLERLNDFKHGMSVKRKRTQLGNQMDENQIQEMNPPKRVRYTSPFAAATTLFTQTTIQFQTEAQKDIAEEIITKMNLAGNKEQLKAFSIIARHIVERDSKQLMLYISGVGGTGKSHVIKAVVMLFSRLGRRRELLLGAPTGIAAVLIKGQTLHSLASMAPIKRQKAAKDNSNMVLTWKGVRYLIIDEISMVGAHFLSEFSIKVRQAKVDELNSDNSLPFGGVSVIYTGDFGQLKPVRQCALYAHEVLNNPSFQQSRNNDAISSINGVFIWRQVRMVVALTQNQRQKDDPDYAAFLSRLRLGRCPYDDLKYVKTRLLSRIAMANPAELAEFWDAPIIVGCKSLRDMLNAKLVAYHASRLGANVFEYHSRDTMSKQPVEARLQNTLWGLSSQVHGESFGKLSLFVGMKVMVTENIAFDAGIVNGTEGVIHGIEYDEDKDGMRYATVAYVHVPGCDIRIDGLEPDIVPIFPSPTSIDFNFELVGMKAQSFTRYQLPLVPAYCYTDYKSQGRSLARVMVDLDTSKGQGPYVMLSRVTSLKGLVILRGFAPFKITHKISEELQNELNRLDALRV